MSAAIPMQRRRDAGSDTWPRVRLGEVCNINMGQSPESSTYNSSSEGLPFYQGNADFGTIHPKPRVWCSAPVKIAKAGDLLISVRAPIGALNFANERCCIGRGLAALSALPNIEYGFLYYALKSKVAELNAKGTGSTFKAINKRALSAISIVLPPLAIQRRIAAKLDLLCDIVTKRKNQLSQLNQLVKSRFVEMFGNVKSSVAIGERFKTQSGGTPKSSENKFYENGTIPWLTSGEVGQGVIRKVDRCITQAGLDNSSAKWTPIDSVLVAMYGATAGKVGLLKIKATTNQAVCSILPAQGMMPEFVYYAVASKTDWMLQQAAGGAQPNISQGVVRKMRIPNPPLALQREFAAFVEKVDKLAFAARRRRDVAKQLYRAKIQEYFG